MNDHPQDRLILRDDRIVETVARLQRRIGDRFPDSGLSRLCGQLLDVSRNASERSAWIGSPIRTLRAAGYATALLLVISFAGIVVFGLRNTEAESVGFLELVQAAEAGLNDIIFFAIAIWFLVSLETRIKRRRALAAVHELRSLAHVIDMHQLTKDPERTLRGWTATAHSPKEKMTALQLNRYLDYCSEMLSLIGKIAALYVQKFDDPPSVAAVSEVEQLTTGLSRKIWQKIIATQNARILQPAEDDSTASRSEVETARQPAGAIQPDDGVQSDDGVPPNDAAQPNTAPAT